MWAFLEGPQRLEIHSPGIMLSPQTLPKLGGEGPPTPHRSELPWEVQRRGHGAMGEVALHGPGSARIAFRRLPVAVSIKYTPGGCPHQTQRTAP